MAFLLGDARGNCMQVRNMMKHILRSALILAFVITCHRLAFGQASAEEKISRNMTPEETVKAMQLADGFRVTAFAGEPSVALPAARPRRKARRDCHALVAAHLRTGAA
jgi:hypothetical protein